MKCELLCEKKERNYIKTPLCGKCQRVCDFSAGTFELFSGECFCNSVGTVTIKNSGTCNVVIYKNNNETCRVATIAPGCCFTLTSSPLYALSAQCGSDASDCAKCCLCWEGCVCSQLDCCM